MVFHPGDMLDKKPDKYGTIGNGLKLTIIFKTDMFNKIFILEIKQFLKPS